MGRILHVTHRYLPAVGGSEQYVHQVARRQAAEGHQVTVVATDAADFSYFWQPAAGRFEEPEATFDGVRLLRTPIRHLRPAPAAFHLLRRLQTSLSRLPGLAGVARRLGRYLPPLPYLAATLEHAGRDWQLVFGWNATFDGLFGAAFEAARQAKCAFIAAPLTHLGEGPASAVGWGYTMPHQLDWLRRADRVLAQTTIEQGYLAQAGVPAGGQALIGAGIDPAGLSQGRREIFRRRHAIEGPLVVDIGPLTRDKGTFQLLEALRRLNENGRPVWLALAGPPMADFERHWRGLPPAVQSRCLRLGVIDERAKADLLAAADVLAHPSRVESFGLVFLEAWACARPVIGALAGGVPAVIDTERDGLLVEYGDSAQLAAAISRLLDNPGEAEAMGRRGRAKLLASYTWDAVYERLRAALPPL
ncbi:MAG: glycosyltransferase family 4 protein [Candidatus Promineifilaceae bacterium]